MPREPRLAWHSAFPRSAFRFSERQVVVLFLERAREVLEIIAALGRRGTGLGRRTRTACARTGTLAVEVAATALAAEQDQLTDVDLGDVLGLPFLVLVLPVLD